MVVTSQPIYNRTFQNLNKSYKQFLIALPFEKRETKAAIIVTIRDTLWQMLPESYSDESIDTYKDAVFEYVQQHYGGVA